MTKDEIKNRISMALKDPILQQGFEIICKENNELENIKVKIEELENENKTVTRKANEAIADKLLITSKYNEVLNDLNQENDKLQKENEELKEKLKPENCLKLLAKEGYIKFTSDQLTKAKEIIKNILHTLKNEGSDWTFALKNTHHVLLEAEQFLKETDE